MRKRSFFLPILCVLLLVVGGVFLIVSLNQDPYETAMQSARKAVESNDFEKAVSQYTIAQNLKPDQKEAYTESLEAIAHIKSGNTVRDILTTVNECVTYCGDESIDASYIVYIADVLIENDMKDEAYDMLSHLYYKLSECETVKEKINEISLEKAKNKESEIVEKELTEETVKEDKKC